MKAEVRSGSIIGIGAFKFGTLLPVQMAAGFKVQLLINIASLTTTGEQTNWELEVWGWASRSASFLGALGKNGLWLQDWPFLRVSVRACFVCLRLQCPTT